MPTTIDQAPGRTSPAGTSIPSLYSLKMRREFLAQCTLFDIANTDWEGELKGQGSEVIIRGLPDIEFVDYAMGAKVSRQTDTKTPTVTLVVDQAKASNVPLDDVEAFQSDIPLQTKWAAHSAAKAKIAVEATVYSTCYSEVDASNKGANAGAIDSNVDLGVSGSPKVLTKANVVDYIVNCGLVLDQQNIPWSDDWFFVLPYSMRNIIARSELRDASITGDSTSPLRNGLIGQIDRFKIYASNNLSSVADGSVTAYNAFFGHRSALGFVHQISKTKIVEPADEFQSCLMTLNVFGSKVVHPTAMGHAYVAVDLS